MQPELRVALRKARPAQQKQARQVKRGLYSEARRWPQELPLKRRPLRDSPVQQWPWQWEELPPAELPEQSHSQEVRWVLRPASASHCPSLPGWALRRESWEAAQHHLRAPASQPAQTQRCPWRVTGIQTARIVELTGTTSLKKPSPPMLSRRAASEATRPLFRRR